MSERLEGSAWPHKMPCDCDEGAAATYVCCAADLKAALAAHDQKVREPLAAWMIANSFATGHGDSVEDLLKELKWQIEERVGKVLEEAAHHFPYVNTMSKTPYLTCGLVHGPYACGKEFSCVREWCEHIRALASPAEECHAKTSD